MDQRIFPKLNFLFIALCLCGSGFAQGDTGNTANRVLATTAIKDLKEGFLLVRLQTADRALKEIEKLKSKAGISPDVLRKIEKKEAQIIKDRDYENEQIKILFESHYTFSKVYYMADTAFRKNGEEDFLDYVMDADGQKVSREKLEGERYLIAYAGINPESGALGIVIADRSIEPLVLPFPGFIKYRYSRMTGIAYRLFKSKPEKTGPHLDARLARWFRNSQR